MNKKITAKVHIAISLFSLCATKKIDTLPTMCYNTRNSSFLLNDVYYPRNKQNNERKNDMNNTKIRFATQNDTSLILNFIKGIAEYEKMSDQVVATEEGLREWIFEKKKAEVIFAMEDGKEVGFALFFHNFSTFLGRAGLYLEDIFVIPEHRGRGHGKALIRELARIAVERKCGRLEWCCLDWNKPSIDFYLSLGAKPMDEWTIYRLSGEELLDFADGKNH